jgi:hypothetical protein
MPLIAVVKRDVGLLGFVGQRPYVEALRSRPGVDGRGSVHCCLAQLKMIR